MLFDREQPQFVLLSGRDLRDAFAASDMSGATASKRCRLDGGGHAAIPKKSLGVTLQAVASAIFSMISVSGTRPFKYRRTASVLTPILAANWARDSCASWRYWESFTTPLWCYKSMFVNTKTARSRNDH